MNTTTAPAPAPAPATTVIDLPPNALSVKLPDGVVDTYYGFPVKCRSTTPNGGKTITVQKY